MDRIARYQKKHGNINRFWLTLPRHSMQWKAYDKFKSLLLRQISPMVLMRNHRTFVFDTHIVT